MNEALVTVLIPSGAAVRNCLGVLAVTPAGFVAVSLFGRYYAANDLHGVILAPDTEDKEVLGLLQRAQQAGFRVSWVR